MPRDCSIFPSIISCTSRVTSTTLRGVFLGCKGIIKEGVVISREGGAPWAVEGREFDGFFRFERTRSGLNGKRPESL